MSLETPKFISRSTELSNIWQGFSSAGVLITNRNASKVLLGNHSEDPNRWGNFAGHKEENESPFETAKREAHEETGLEIDPRHFGVPLIVIDDGKIGIIFPITIPEKTLIKLPNDGEILRTAWFTPDQVMERIIDQIDNDWAYDNTWGRAYTLEALRSWMQSQDNFMKDFGGVVEIESHPAFI